MKRTTSIDMVRRGLSRAGAPLAFFAVLAALSLIALEALARAGGGGNYSGGGGGFGGGGGGEGLGALIYLAIAYPEVGVPLLVVVVVVGAVKRARNPDRRTRRAVERLEQIGGADSSELAGVEERDPGFGENAFLDKVRKLEDAVQRAWNGGEMSQVRTMLSDGLLRRFETQLEIMRFQGVRNAMADHEVLEARIHAVESDSHFDTIHVALRATARDVEVDASLSAEQAAARAARARPEVYTEIWSFLRRPGAKTLESGGAVEGYCPNCGAPVEVGQTARCDHCGVLINSGEHDWVLAEITQPEEWRPSSSGEVPGRAELVARDPGFNRQAAEDRASYLFWRWIEALVTARDGALAKVASADFRGRVSEQVKGGAASHFKTAVGSVDLLSCRPGPEGGRDRIDVKVLWSSAPSQKAAPIPAANVLTLSRAAGAVSEGGGLSHARCPSCHGPLTENDSPRCEYCGADLAAGESEWILDGVLRPEELRVERGAAAASSAGSEAADEDEVPFWVAPDMGDPRERRLLLMRMAAVVAADGRVTKAERRLLANASKRWRIPLESVQPILAGEVDLQTVSMMKPSNPGGFIAGLISAALVDGKIDKKEEKLLLDVGRNLSMSDADTRNLMRAMEKSQATRKAG